MASIKNGFRARLKGNGVFVKVIETGLVPAGLTSVAKLTGFLEDHDYAEVIEIVEDFLAVDDADEPTNEVVVLVQESAPKFWTAQITALYVTAGLIEGEADDETEVEEDEAKTTSKKEKKVKKNKKNKKKGKGKTPPRHLRYSRFPRYPDGRAIVSRCYQLTINSSC